MKKLNPNAGIYLPPLPSERPMPSSSFVTTVASAPTTVSVAPGSTEEQLTVMFVHARSAYIEALSLRGVPVTAIDSVAFERFLYRTFMFAHSRDLLWITSTSAPIGSTIPQIQPFWLRFPLTHWALASDIIAEVELQRLPRPPSFSSSGDLAAEHLSAYHQDRELLKGVYTMSLAPSLSPQLKRVLALSCADVTSVTRPQIDAFVQNIITVVFIVLRGAFIQKIQGPNDSVGHLHYTAATQSLSALLEKVTCLAGISSIAALALPMMLLSRAHLPQLRMHSETAASVPHVGKQMNVKLKFFSTFPGFVADLFSLAPNVSVDQAHVHLLRSEMFADVSNSVLIPTINNWMTVVYSALSQPEQTVPLVEPELAAGSLLDMLGNKFNLPKPMATFSSPGVSLTSVPSPGQAGAPALLSASASSVNPHSAPYVPIEARVSVGVTAAQQAQANTAQIPVVTMPQQQQQHEQQQEQQQQQQQQQQQHPVTAVDKSEFFASTMQATSLWFGEDNAVHYALIGIATSDADPSLLNRILSALRDAYSNTPSNFEPLFSIMTESTKGAEQSATAQGGTGGSEGASEGDVEAAPPASAIPQDLLELLHILSVTLRSGNSFHTRSILTASQIVDQRVIESKSRTSLQCDLSATSLTSNAVAAADASASGDTITLWSNSAADASAAANSTSGGNIW